jgi:ACS family glucarate transporter-like MFS transporter
MSTSNQNSGQAATLALVPQQGTPAYPRFRWFMLVTVTFGYFAAGVFLIIFAPILGVVAQDFGISIGEATLLLITTFAFSNAVATIGSGMLIDRFGVRPCIIAGGVLTVLAALSVPVLGGSLAGMVAMRVLLGLGFGPVSACVSAVAARWFPPPERGLVAGVQGSGIALGIALTFGAMPAASQAYHGNWRAGMSWFAIVAIVGLVLCLLTLLGKEPEVPWERKLLTLLETSNWPCGNRHFIWVLPPCWALLGS